MKKLLTMIAAAALLASCGGTGTTQDTATARYEKSTVDWAKNANIYEVNIRQYSQEGTFNAFAQNLPRLKEQGVDILWLMPIYPISEEGRKGTLGSYYAVKDYTAVNPEFGTLDDLKSLVNQAHKLGMKVILDWVANHTGKDNVWTKEHKDYFNLDSLGNPAIPEGTDWDDVADLDYDNPELRKAMVEAMKFWIKNADIDGFRCDVAGMVPTDFWVAARAELDKLKPVFMLAEDDKPEIHKAFDASYNWKVHHVLNKIAQGKNTADSLAEVLLTEEKDFGGTDILMNFTSNHDENSWSKSEYDRMGGHVKQMAVLTYFLPGMPLCYSGQEAANKKALEFFEKDVIDFSSLPLKDFYAQLNAIKHKYPSLWNNDIQILSTDKNIFVFDRGDIRCIFNFNAEPADITVDFKGEYADVFNEMNVYNPGEQILTVEARGWKCAVKK